MTGGISAASPQPPLDMPFWLELGKPTPPPPTPRSNLIGALMLLSCLRDPFTTPLAAVELGHPLSSP